ncbi:alanine--glyoxylate aminotransferase family protein [Candidatus Pacearchaeota archaeon]|nr:alanine--glyoxylate aminotransferase family protein [Candidatus Pacearchaeota archaeon]
MKRFTILSAGPVKVSENVRNSMGDYHEIGHREEEFSELFKRVKEKSLKVFEVNPENYSVVFISGSGTAATECVLSSVLHKNKKTLVVSNGAFGERIIEICNLHKIPLVALNYSWGDYPSPKDIEEKLEEDKEIEAVVMVQMETSTGILNPVNSLGDICKKHNKTYIVDAMSGFGADPLSIQKDNIDFLITNSNKGIGGLPVFGIICYKKLSLEKSKDLEKTPRSFSLDLFKHVKYAEKLNQTPFTPQIPYFHMSNAAFDDLIKEGVENRIARYRENTILVRKGLLARGFKLQYPDNAEKRLSGIMTNYLLPEGVKYQELHDALKEKGYVVYPGKGELEGRIVHLATIGSLATEDVEEFINSLDKVLSELKLS